MATDPLDAKVQIFAEMVKSLAAKGRLSTATKQEMRVAFEEARRARLTPAERYAETKGAVVKAGESALVTESPSAATPSIQLVNRGASRQAASALHGPPPERKPGEAYGAFRARVVRHVSQQLGQRADQVARALDVSTDPVLGMAEREVRYQGMKAAELAKGRDAGKPRPAPVQTLAESTSLDKLARALMRSRGQVTDPKSPKFNAGEYRQALLEVSPK